MSQEVLEHPLTMKLILKELDYFEVLKLRKVSSGIRNCVDDLKPDSKLKSYTIRLDRHLHSTLIELTSGAYKEIKYFPAKTGGCVDNNYFEKLDARAQSLKDAEAILKNQKTCMEIGLNLLENPIFRKFRISYLNSTIDESLHELIGEPYRTVPNIKKVWYFRIPDTEYYMHISLDTHNLMYDNGSPKLKALVINRVRQEDTPF
ncbi:unnamed protein product [Caenorhabditis nigoni]